MDSPTSSLKQLRNSLNQQEEAWLSPMAALSCQAIRRRQEDSIEDDHRQNFALDSDRVLHSMAYTRYIDKTQVFYLIDNDHLTHRVLHVQLVSKIARTIARFLRLNEDLVEAIALAHDIGHCPFGHDGEYILSDICRGHGIGEFVHAVQGTEFLERIEKRGRGLNLSLQVLDGVLCHDGETHEKTLTPERGKNFQTFDQERQNKQANRKIKLIPSTMEGCVVRIADTISYIGRDLEDAIRIGLIDRRDLPEECRRSLGETNGRIVYNLTTAVIRYSQDQPYITLGEEMAEALGRLKQFNYERIYLNPKIKSQLDKIKHIFEHLFRTYLRDLEQGKRESIIFTDYLKDMSSDYINETAPAAIVRDLIAGMTDKYFINQYNRIFIPQPITRNI
ncbi:MAG: HD domain-containing protein [Deltaproteobacteria bacterium]|nr:HD domain-containing protein [Deltaproteobacteria bacterium]